jgi:hypothetical protein
MAPRGWRPFFVRHELIHCCQAENLGRLAFYLQAPLAEGMANSLSDDPHNPLCAPFEQWRPQFEEWRDLQTYRIWLFPTHLLT